MVTISAIEPGSPAAAAGLRAGDRIKAVNGAAVSDDFEFSFFSSEDDPELTVIRDGQDTAVTVERDMEEPLGIVLKPVPYRSCGNNCIFCFVDQLPKGMRKTLYFKDEDYRLSFLYGNYITCSGISDGRIDRIIEMGMSPLYVSVHATDERIRNKLLGVRKGRPILEILKRLAAGGITVHTQVVVCPGINDRHVLDKTIDDLAALHPHVASVAVIPVGITSHRGGLPRLKQITRSGAWKLQNLVAGRQRRYLKQLKTRFVFAADELYLRAEVPVPPQGAYEDWAQLENGVGMVRRLLDSIRAGRPRLIKKSAVRMTVLIITGHSMAPVLREQLAGFRGALRLRVVGVQNHLLGKSITVSGLLPGADIAQALIRQRIHGDVMLLPPNCLNDDGVFLDNMTPDDLAAKTGIKVCRGDYDLPGSVLRALRA